MTKGRANLLIIGPVAFLGAFGILRLLEQSSWVGLWGAGAITAATLSALMLAARGRGQLFQSRRQLGISMILVGLGIVAMGIFMGYTTQIRAYAVIGLLSGISSIAGGVFAMKQGGRIGRISEAESALGDQEVGDGESSPR